MKIGRCELTADEVIGALESQSTLILATCADSRITTRPMSHINVGLAVFFQTGKDSLKIRQICANPNVALHVGGYEIEGTASVLGHPLEESNAWFAQAYQAKHPASYKRYTAMRDETVVKVTVDSARQWRYIDRKPLIAELKRIKE